MKKILVGMIVVSIALLAILGCDTGSNSSNPSEESANTYVGTWQAIHVYVSGYTDPVDMPVAAKKQTNTMHIFGDGTYTESLLLVLVDDSTQSGSYSGVYTSTESSITFTEKSGAIEGIPVSEQYLGQNTFLLSGSNTLVEKDSNSAESPEDDSSGNPLYPIVLTYIKQ